MSQSWQHVLGNLNCTQMLVETSHVPHNWMQPPSWSNAACSDSLEMRTRSPWSHLNQRLRASRVKENLASSLLSVSVASLLFFRGVCMLGSCSVLSLIYLIVCFCLPLPFVYSQWILHWSNECSNSACCFKCGHSNKLHPLQGTEAVLDELW